MKKTLFIVIIVLVVILALPAISFIRWAFQEKKPLGIIILDKTVPTLERINHKSLSYVLTSERFVKKSGGSYSYRKDYFGFFPLKPMKSKDYRLNNLKLPDVMDVVEKTDVLYYADTYGVFFNDWWTGINKSRKSRKLVGGLNNSDYLYLVEMQRRNRLCILEYNSFDYPTAPLEAYKTKERMGIEFGGWTGKYFATLDTAAKGNEDFPIWMTQLFRKQYRKPWSFNKPGVVFLKGSDIIVLEEGTHLKNAVPIITTDSVYRQKYGLPEKVAFDGWFDVIDPLKSKVVSNYNLETTPAGDTLLFENMLAAKFPAVITDTVNQRNYYFCGDFAANKVDFWTARLKGFGGIKGINYSERENDPRRFFWLYYKPLINGLFTEYYNSTKER
jgi:hypothetical protein